MAVVQGRLGAFAAILAESQSQRAMIEQLYQDLARRRDDWALVEVEQSVILAAQQLQLTGNVRAAVHALQSADARLAASNRPQFISRVWIGRYFEPSTAALHTADGALEQLAATEISIELPTLNESLAAIGTFRLGRDGR
ncbi:MAG: uroporphyrinogen-III C-methyltransferase [Candidatus Accumulibacter phosphatis]|uniref:uroporphyrinogen-III C-methyltransferase n=1 Tax=Candidatus Accumulibacter phosphatis TaxID=327160 RepID=UPI001A495D52|nr:uroporphyrinogen-III C-methyltransferase [Candidatus Accumulibacter phosphatis]